MASLPVFTSIFMLGATGALAFNPPLNAPTDQADDKHMEVLTADDFLIKYVRMTGYESLDPVVRTRDQQRITRLISSCEQPMTWPLRDAYASESLDDFPVSAGTPRAFQEPIQLFVIVNPSEIDSAWTSQHTAKGPSTVAFPSLNGSQSSCISVAIEPSTFKQTGFIHYKWPTWADSAVVKNSELNFPTNLLENTTWSTVATTAVGYNNSLSQSLRQLKVPVLDTNHVIGVSDTVWRVVPPNKPADGPQLPRGQLVFPLWESTGLLRDATTDPWLSKRNGPMSSYVESPDFDWTINGRNSFVIAAPIPRGFHSPTREFVVVPELLSRFQPPILSFYKSNTWKPLAEDYVVRAGAPTTPSGLRAVCVFMTCSDEQLKAVLDALINPAPEAIDSAKPK